MFTLIRLAILLIMRRWGLIVVGTVLAIAGLIVGVTSHQVTYQTVNKGTIIHYLYGQNDSGGDDNNDAYIELQDGSLYFLNESDFSPALNSDTIQSQVVSMAYDPTNTKSIDISSSNTSTHLSGTGDQVVQLTSFDSNGQNPATFTTSEYQQNPKGFYQNNWAGGAALLVLGLLIGGAALLLPMFMPGLAAKAKQGGPGFSMSAPANGVPPMNGQYGSPVSPYQQPYPGAASYPQQGGYPPYGQPPQQGPINPTPYGQPPAYPPTPGSYDPTRYAPPPDPTQYGSPYNRPPNA